jgi:DNA-binding MarR family transcriptional regulator
MSLPRRGIAKEADESTPIAEQPNVIDQELPFELYQSPGHLIRRLNQIFVAVFSEFTQTQAIKPLEHAALVTIRRFPGSDQRQLARLAAFDRSTSGSILAALERRGLVVRRANPDDARYKEVYITQAGADLLRQVRDDVLQVQATMLCVLEPTERTEIMRLLLKLVDGNNGWSRAPLMKKDGSKSQSRCE